MVERLCVAEDCPTKPRYRAELCEMHLQRQRRGSPADAPVRGRDFRRPTDSGSAKVLVERASAEHGWDLLRYARSRVADHATAEDIVQDAMFRLWQHGDDFTGCAEAVRPWLFVTVKRLTITEFHREMIRARTESADVLLDEVGSLRLSDEVVRVTPRQLQEDPVSDWIACQPLLDAVAQLSDAQREAVVAMAVVGMSGDETAEMLGISAGSVRQNVFNARRRLREMLALVPPSAVA